MAGSAHTRSHPERYEPSPRACPGGLRSPAVGAPARAAGRALPSEQARYRRALALALLALTLAWAPGCGRGVFPDLRREAEPLKSFRALLEDPEAFRGKLVILGGEVIETRNLPEETLVRVLQKPLDRSLRPRDEDVSEGRFLVRFHGYLDPVLYAPGRRLTVAGVVRGSVTEPVGQMPYRYPVLEAKRIHLWKQVEPPPLPWRPPDVWYPWWYDPNWGRRPWWW